MLRYATPARDWDAALPIGNGRLGAMSFGGVHSEVIQLNEDSVWYGGPQNRTPVGAKAHLATLRHLVRSGKHYATEKLVKDHFLAIPKSARHYEPLGTCNIEFDYGAGDHMLTSYERTLNLSTAEATVQYDLGGIHVQRSICASYPDNVIIIRISATEKISFTVNLTRKSDIAWEVNEFLDSTIATDGRIILHATPGGKASNSLCLVTGVRSDDKDGVVEVLGGGLQVSAKEALIVLAAQTQYRHSDVENSALTDVDAAFEYSTLQLHKRHIDDWALLYNRMSIQLYPDASKTLTEKRMKDHLDPGLISLYHAYARYLLLSCSRPGAKALPANLQGIWNPTFQPPWGAKFTININLQMNYWPVHVANISECEYPVFDLLNRMAVNGRTTAQEVYGCRGWCAHHCTDIFGDTETQDQWMPATLWPFGGAWMCTNIWEHYLYTGDKELLVRMIPVLEGCVQFVLDFLIPDTTGEYLITNPSLSPENTFFHPASGEKGVFCEGSTMDVEIIRLLFTQYMHVAEIITHEDRQESLVSEVMAAITKLPPIIISPKTGTIQEWGLNDHEETELGHRHVSHLYGLHPGNTITTSKTPELAAAAKKTLLRRLEHGGGHTGWSRAWLINLWARLREPRQCAKNIAALLKDSTLPNMLDTHPPFQIDGNFGGGAGIVECLVQSHEEEQCKGEEGSRRIIRLLPSCPVEWKVGSVAGVKCRGGFELSFSWDNGTINEPVTIHSLLGSCADLIIHQAGVDSSDVGVRLTIASQKGSQMIYYKRVS